MKLGNKNIYGICLILFCLAGVGFLNGFAKANIVTEQQVDSSNARINYSAASKEDPVASNFAPTLIRVEKLAKQQDPRVSGTLDNALSIKDVKLSQSKDGANIINISGTALPGETIKVFIFSNNPYVITLRADANGNWSYELDRDLEDGSHQAYVAIVGDNGQIISKSQPFAFIKTAQAISAAPTDLSASKSPMEKNSQSLTLIASISIIASLVVAILLIGFITYKRHLK